MQIYVLKNFIDEKNKELQIMVQKRLDLMKDKEEARSQGDLRENFGYQETKKQLAMLETQMGEAANYLKDNQFIEIDPKTWATEKPNKCTIGALVTLTRINPNNKKPLEETYLICPAHAELKTFEGIELLPYNSPFATAIHNKKTNESFSIKLPTGISPGSIKSIKAPTPIVIHELCGNKNPPEIEKDFSR
jgi:transcription elongation factor GreA